MTTWILSTVKCHLEPRNTGRNLKKNSRQSIPVNIVSNNYAVVASNSLWSITGAMTKRIINESKPNALLMSPATSFGRIFRFPKVRRIAATVSSSQV